MYLSPTPQRTQRPTLEHLGTEPRGAGHWATPARRATRRAAHTHLGHTRTSLHVDARIHTPGSLQTRTLAPRKTPPPCARSPLTTRYPSRVPAAHAGRALSRSHRPLHRTPGTPPEPSGFPLTPRHCPAVSPLTPTSPPPPSHRAHLFRGRPRAAPRAHTQEGPRALAAHPEAALAAQLGTSCSVSSFWGGGRRAGGAGEREAPRPRRPPQVLAPAALRSAPRAAAAATAAAGPSPPRPASEAPGAARPTRAGARGCRRLHAAPWHRAAGRVPRPPWETGALESGAGAAHRAEELRGIGRVSCPSGAISKPQSPHYASDPSDFDMPFSSTSSAKKVVGAGVWRGAIAQDCHWSSVC